MNKAYLLLGSNLGDRALFLKSALANIEAKAGKILSASSIYESEAWGNTDEVLPAHLNQAVIIATSLTPLNLLLVLQAIENSLERKRESKWGSRTIDIDIIFYNNEIINLKELIIPHPYFTDRMFALVPMQEIAANYLHPVFNKSITDLQKECNDELGIKKV